MFVLRDEGSGDQEGLDKERVDFRSGKVGDKEHLGGTELLSVPVGL